MADMQEKGDPEHPPGGLNGLPMELKTAVLAFSCDFDSLQALVHTSTLFFHAYVGARKDILSTVVIREIHPDVLSDALAVLECPRASTQVAGKHGDSPSPSEVYAFIDSYKPGGQAELPPSLPLPISKALICFHQKIIRYFAKDFGSSMRAVHPMSTDSTPCSSPLSSSEIRRIHRALYRFELYYRLFAGSQFAVSEWMGFPAPTIMFLSLYPPWEVEELHCVHDFLYRRFLVAYIDVAQHDVRMGYAGMHSGPLRARHLGLFDNQIEHCLSLGLTHVYDAVTLPGLETRIELTSTNFRYKYFPGVVLGYYKIVRLLGHAEGGRVPDSKGNGPNEAWCRWKGYLPYPMSSNLEHPLMELRKWGYCMWDSNRLRAWDVLRDEYDEAYFRQKFAINSEETKREWMEALGTETIRARVWLRGGSGYWTEDESQIVWSGGPRVEKRADAVAKRPGIYNV